MLGSTGYEQTNFDLLVDISRGIDDDSMSLSLIFDAEVFDGEVIE